MKTSAEKMISRYLKLGGNKQTGRKLLTELQTKISPTNLPVALFHHGFISRSDAERLQLSSVAPILR